MKKTKTMRRVLLLGLVLVLLLGVLASCGGGNETKVDYSREYMQSTEDYFAKVLNQSPDAKEKFVAASHGYNMSAEGFDDNNLPAVVAGENGVTSITDANGRVWNVTLEGAKKALESMAPADEAAKATYLGYIGELTDGMIPTIVLKMQTTVELEAKKGPIDTLLTWIGKFLQIITKITAGYYVLALFIFAVIIELLMLPFGIKQQKNSIKQMQMRPKEMAIRKKYAGRTDQATMQKMQAEIQKMYQEEGVNPLGGCLPLLIQLPIVLALYNIVVDPLLYVLGKSQAFSAALTTYATTARAAGGLGLELAKNSRGTIELLSHFNSDAIAGLGSFDYFLNAGDCAATLTGSTFPNLNLFGLNMGLIPGFHKPWALLIIPVLTFGVYFASMKISRKLSYQPVTVDQQTGCSNNMMDIGMPAMSVYITFITPAAVGIYWIFKSIIGTLKQFILHKVMPMPVFTEEDYKAAERELKGKKPPKRRAGEQTAASGKVVRSLHHIDDEEDEVPAPAAKPETSKKQEESAPEEGGMAAPLKQDRKDSKK